MKLHTSNETHSAFAETDLKEHGWCTTLRCVAKDEASAVCELPGHVRGLLLHGDRLLCLMEQDAPEGKKGKNIVLYAFDMLLKELSREVLAGGSYGFHSTMDAEYIYILDKEKASTTLPNDTGWHDFICELRFTRINIETGARTEWALEDGEENTCYHTLFELAGGEITDIDEIRAFEGKFILSCSVFDSDSEVETENDEPALDGSRLNGNGYVECHSFSETICADVDAQKLSTL